MSAEPRKAIALSQAEQTALVLCEAEIEEGKAAFIAVGNALARIKAEKLYRGTHGTFEAYCQDRWSFSLVSMPIRFAGLRK